VVEGNFIEMSYATVISGTFKKEATSFTIFGID
jgi:hypothetical protein